MSWIWDEMNDWRSESEVHLAQTDAMRKRIAELEAANAALKGHRDALVLAAHEALAWLNYDGHEHTAHRSYHSLKAAVKKATGT